MTKRLHISFLLMTLLQLLAAVYAHAQEPIMKHYTTRDGLTSNTVYMKLSDKKGYLWFCTDAGVSRFDGHKFTTFTVSDGLSDNEMLRVHEDSKGRVWFLGFNGTLSYYYNGVFFNPNNDSVLSKAKSKTSFLYFFEDRQHRLWFTSETEYILIDGQQVRRINNKEQHICDRGMVLSGSGNNIYILACDTVPKLYSFDKDTLVTHKVKYNRYSRGGFCYLKDGGVLFWSKEGLVRQKDTVQKLIIPKNINFNGITEQEVFVSSKNKLWISTIADGVYCYDYADMSKPPEHYLSNKVSCDTHEDIEGNIWISTLDDGVYMLPAGYNSIANYNAGNGLTDNPVFAVAKDSSGNVYAGMNKGIVTKIYKNQSRALLLNGKSQRYNRVIKIEAHGKNVWFGSNNYLACLNTTTNISFNENCIHPATSIIGPAGGVKDICYHNNKLIVCVSHDIYISRETGVKSNDLLQSITGERRRSYCVYADHKGTVWYGAQGGLYSYNKGANTYHSCKDLDNGVRITSITETRDSVLVLATYGYGVFFYKNDKIIGRLSVQNGLSSDICKRAFVYKDKLYIATVNGANIVTYSNDKARVSKVYTITDGLLSNDVNDIFADSIDICIATSEGLSIIKQDAGEHIPIVQPLVYITAIRNNGRVLQPDSSYTLSHTNNSLHLDFVAISYRYPKETHYEYRLNELQSWVTTNATSIDFPFLAPGNYRFQLRARILNGPRTDAKTFSFTIKPPFWKTYWFVALCAAAFIVLVVLSARYIIKAAKHKQQEDLKIKDQVAQLEQQAIQAMMNPHFIFNVMNSIQYYINNNEKHEANIYLSNFARLIRMNLDISSKRYIPVDEEVAYLELYLSLETLRFGNRLTYKIDIDPAIDGDETMIPVMLLQPFIENAIWHGILPKQESGHVLLSIVKQADGMLKATITDNGTGISKDEGNSAKEIKTHSGKGMKMTMQRLYLIGKITGRSLYINIQDAYPGHTYKGTRVELLLPGNLS